MIFDIYIFDIIIKFKNLNYSITSLLQQLQPSILPNTDNILKIKIEISFHKHPSLNLPKIVSTHNLLCATLRRISQVLS